MTKGKKVKTKQILGRHARRLQDPINGREVAFAETWSEHNSWEWNARPTLAMLLCASMDQQSIERELTESEIICAATVVQWLGSNVGFSFLEEALGKAGYRIVPKDAKK